ncbi:hypothetical protein SO802_012419 [Lithocarpus litseifolius]|uniref:Uncharacterized protein n=1 Tax=Lithocarpus litseifolius TaxID=425828 RepID=A0AAW2D568_9ROSI
MSSSNSSLKKEIDEYQDVSVGSFESSEGSTSYSSTSSDEPYLSRVPGIPLEEFQELQRRKASGAATSSSREPMSPSLDEEEEENVIYSCAPEGTVVSGGKRKSKPISSFVDLSDLPSRRGPKRQKPSKTPLPKVPKFTPPTVNLDDPVEDVEPVQIIPPVQTDPTPPPTKTPRRPHPSESSQRPLNLVLDEDYAWRTFKGIISDNEVNSCYNMSIRDFERSSIHDLFKAMSKFYIANCQAKELFEEAKTAKEKAKELNTEVLLKKGEVIWLTEDLTRLQGSETKLKDEVEELRADVIEKDTRIAHLDGQVSEFASSLEKAVEEAVAAFKRSD